MRKLFIILALLALVGFVIWYAEKEIPGLDVVNQYVENGDILTLEARYTPEQVMEAHKKELLSDNRKAYGEAQLKFYPYLMMDVKYNLPGQRTKESTILWGLVDGEMVLNTDNWETTHGFEDAIEADANRNDFRILNALSQNKNVMTKDQLQKELRVESDILEPMIENARSKHLITVKGNQIELHFENPKFLVTPQTKMNQWIVTKPYSHAQRIPRKFTKSQIEKITKAAFGQDFTVRNVKEVFLPVYSIQVINPDGSILTSFWNALTGNRMGVQGSPATQAPAKAAKAT